MSTTRRDGRRGFLRRGAATGAAFLAAGFAGAGAARSAEVVKEPLAERKTGVSPLEALMQEHGLQARLLLIYEESARRLDSGEEFPAPALGVAAIALRDAVEKHHERIEEEHIFPPLEQAGKLVALCRVLRRHHAVGRVLTNNIILTSGPDLMERPEDHAKLARWLRQYVRMMRPHAAREATDVYPEFRKLASKEEYGALSRAVDTLPPEVVEKVGFEEWVARVARLEAMLGLDNLALVTPS
jgi:hemerythrin-like domain-containing protein